MSATNGKSYNELIDDVISSIGDKDKFSEAYSNLFNKVRSSVKIISDKNTMLPKR